MTTVPHLYCTAEVSNLAHEQLREHGSPQTFNSHLLFSLAKEQLMYSWKSFILLISWSVVAILMPWCDIILILFSFHFHKPFTLLKYKWVGWGYCSKEVLVWIWFKSQSSFKQNTQIFLFSVVKKNKQVFWGLTFHNILMFYFAELLLFRYNFV